MMVCAQRLLERNPIRPRVHFPPLAQEGSRHIRFCRVGRTPRFTATSPPSASERSVAGEESVFHPPLATRHPPRQATDAPTSRRPLSLPFPSQGPGRAEAGRAATRRGSLARSGPMGLGAGRGGRGRGRRTDGPDRAVDPRIARAVTGRGRVGRPRRRLGQRTAGLAGAERHRCRAGRDLPG